MINPATTTVQSAGLRPTFSLATMLLAITILAVWLSLYRIEPALAVLVFVPLSFALLRTHRAIKVRAQLGTGTPSGRKVKLFAASFYLGIVICLICGLVAAISLGFLVVCGQVISKYSEIPNSHSFWLVLLGLVGMAFSVVAAQVSVMHFVWSTWPRRSNIFDEQVY